MDAGKRNEIEARLKRMLEDSRTRPVNDTNKPKQAVCNVIRRRKGEQDKRILVVG